MKLTIMNTGIEATTLAGDDLALQLEPGESADVESEGGVLIYGPKPGVVDQFKQVAHLLKELLLKLKKPTPAVQVSAQVTNHGPNSVRIILGDGVTDETIAPNVTFSGAAMYLELRELGKAPQQGGTPD